MANSSISIDVKAANSKLAQSLRKREEDEAILQIGKRKIRDVAKKEHQSLASGKKAKWKSQPDFSQPTPMVDRPRTTEGSTSFHFSYSTISKEGSPTLQGRPVSGGRSNSTSPGSDHSKYIEREGAAERSAGAEHAAYVERDGAVETLDPTGDIAEGIERTISAMVNENAVGDEAQMLGLEDIQPGIPSIFSNISNDQFEREEFWRAVHRCERDPKSHQIILDPESSPRWWDAVETSPDIETAFKNHCVVVRERHRRWLESEAVKPSGKPFAAEPWMATSEGCGRILDGARKTPGWNDIDAPITFKSGRGGRVQIRFVAELPHEITAEDRALLVQNFCDHLGSFAKDDAGNPIGLMYTAVVHAPDAHNDRRNYHLHVIAHDRPAKYLDEQGAWDFEVTETYKDPGSRKDRVRYPFRQNKIGQVSQGRSKTGIDASGRDFIPSLRAEFARISNAVLKTRGVDRRLDPRRYEEMGIDRTPTEHLGTRAAALEAIGVPTIVGRLNAIAIWNDAEKAIRKRAAAVDQTLRDAQAELIKVAADAQALEAADRNLRPFQRLLAERADLISNVVDDRREVMIFDHLESKAKSRAIRTRQTCLQFLNEIDKGIADRTTRDLEPLIRKRWADAQNHIERIDRELEPDRPMLARAAEDIQRREDRIRQIDSLLMPMRASLENAVRIAAGNRTQTERERRRAEARKTLAEAANAARRDRAATPTEPSSSMPREPAPDPSAVEAADASALPIPSTTRTDDAPAAVTPAAPTTQPATSTGTVRATTNDQSSTKENDDVRRTERPDRAKRNSVLAAVGRYALAALESYLDRPDGGPAPKTLAGLRKLSGLGVVPDRQGAQVSLLGFPTPVVGRSGAGAGDGVRRAGSGDRPAAQADGEGRRLNPAAVPSEAGRTIGSRPEGQLPPALGSPSIEGVPIVNPTIDPRSTPILSEAPPVNGGSIPDPTSPGTPAPAGLTPLRPERIVDPKIPSSATIASIDDVDGTTGGAAPAATGGDVENHTDLGTPAPTGTAADPTSIRPDGPASTSVEVTDGISANTGPRSPDKVDGRLRDQPPTLFPIDPSVAPTKPGTSQAEFETWDAIINRISSERIPILRTVDSMNRSRYEVPSLSEAERETLASPRFAKRTLGRLTSIHDNQKREVDRLVRWIDKNGRNPENLVLENRTARIEKGADSVRRLMRDWRTHPTITTALRAENQRRIEAARERAAEAVRQQPAVRPRADEAAARAERIAAAALLYPLPSDAATRQVRELLRLLRNDGRPDQLQAAADAVRSDPVAREDVHRHRVELSKAYNAIIDNDILRLARERDRRGGR